MTADPDHNPPLSQVLVKGPEHLIKPTNEAGVQPPSPRRAVEPRPQHEARPTIEQIVTDYDPDGNNRHPFDGVGRLR